jgi:adenosylcobinamide-GDP ribazoletransferase
MSDAPPQPPQNEPAGRLRPFAEFVHAARFLTRVPVPFSRTIDPPPLHQTMRLFPVVGALIGVLIAGAVYGLSRLNVPSLLACLLAVAVGLILTGALHEDGFADFADGMGGGKTKERRLEIMRDSRIGSYGGLALITCVLARVFALEALLSTSLFTLLTAVGATHAFSRAMMVDLLWATPPARSDGLSVMAGTPSRNVTLFAAVIGLACTLGCGYFAGAEAAVIALGAGLAATAAIRWLAMRLIGGQTGDVAGAAQVACELAMLTAFAATID